MIAQTKSTITCPKCGFSRAETMPTDACQYFWQCPSCRVTIRPKAGDCCVYCSYGDTGCPSRQ